MNADCTPYRHFAGNAREAFETYASIFGLELNAMTYGQSGFAEQAGGDETTADLIMHAELRADGRKVLFGADVPPSMAAGISPSTDTAVSITGGNEILEDVKGYWLALSEGAEILMPLESAPWGATFGQLRDRFGTLWMFNVDA